MTAPIHSAAPDTQPATLPEEYRALKRLEIPNAEVKTVVENLMRQMGIAVVEPRSPRSNLLSAKGLLPDFATLLVTDYGVRITPDHPFSPEVLTLREQKHVDRLLQLAADDVVQLISCDQHSGSYTVVKIHDRLRDQLLSEGFPLTAAQS